MLTRSRAVVLAFLACAGGLAAYRVATRVVPGPSLLMNGWGLSPAGEHVRVGDMPVKMVLSPDGKQAVVATLGFAGVHLTTLDVATHRTIQSLELDRVWNGLAFSPDGKTLYVAGGNAAKLTSYAYDAGRLTKKDEVKAPEHSFVSGVAVSPTTGRVYACNEAFNQLYILEPDLKLVGIVNTGSNPHTAVFGEDKRHLYVSNWGSKSVTVIDTQTNAHVRDIRVGVRPNDMALAPDGRLFVACAGDNTVHTIQTRAPEAAVGGPTRATRPPEGVREIPEHVDRADAPRRKLARRRRRRAGRQDALRGERGTTTTSWSRTSATPGHTRVAGFIPTGWYPTSVAVVGDQLLVAVGKGLRSRANAPARIASSETQKGVKFDYIGNTLDGYVSFVKVGDPKALADWTAKVRANTPFRVANVGRTAARSASIVPDAVTKGSPIKHVLYVIMENRTYDQVFGDLPQGNGDPSLVMYGERVTPNRHALAREYTLLDSLYCNGEVSYDGHSWCDAAIATDEMQKQWTSGYSDHGDVVNAEELQVPTAGYIWDAARRAGLSVKTYGEGDVEYLGGHAVPVDSRGTWPQGRDKDRVAGWIKDLNDAEKTGKWADFMIMSLGEDHTSGTRPGAFTPDAAVASNDQAIGKIVAAASRSRFWKETAIFFVEDDAQDGPDHVDAHRTFALAVSPWVRRGAVDSTMYSQASIVRTVELLLGLPPMTQYDAAATPMFATFGRAAKAVPYTLRPPQVDLEAKNAPNAPGAQASLKMNLDEYDKAPAGPLNRILWAAAKPGVPYPGIRRSFGR